MRSRAEKIRRRVEVMGRIRDAIEHDPVDAHRRLGNALAVLVAAAFLVGAVLGVAVTLAAAR